MKIKKLGLYKDNVPQGVDNLYPTPPDAFKQPCLQMVVGQRTSGKSYLTSIMLDQATRDKTFNTHYIVTPSFNSNRAYFGRYIKECNVFEPTKTSISEVICLVERERDEWEQFQADLLLWKEFNKDRDHLENVNAYQILQYYDLGFLDKQERPTWKYEVEEPPKSLLILDDCLGSPAITRSSGLTRIATLNRHIAPMKQDYNGRSACGLAVIILTQTYRMNNGISRCLRENVSLLTLFKNKQEKQINAIKEELANVVELDLFDKAYEYAVKEKHGNLTVDFNPKCLTKQFRKNLNEVIQFDEIKCECKGVTLKTSK